MLTKDQVYSALNEFEGRVSLGAYVDGEPAEQLNADRKRTAASLIKPFIFYYAAKNRGKFDKIVSVEKIGLTDDTILRFFSGSSISLNGLLSLMIDISDNSVSNYFLDRIGLDTINGFLISEGFSGTSFGRRFLDSDARSSGHENYTTVADLYALFDGVLRGNLLEPEEKKLFEDIFRTQFDRSKFAFYLPETIESGGKSGVLDNVWNDLIFFSQKGKAILLIAMTEDLPRNIGRDLLASFSYHFVKGRFPDALRETP